MALPDKFRLLSPFYFDKEIKAQGGNQTFRFYPNSVRCAARMSGLLSDLAGHISVLLGKTKQDQSLMEEETIDPETKEKLKMSAMQAINPDLAELRSMQRQRAVQGAIKALMDEKHRLAIAELLMDSLRDDFNRTENRPVSDIQDFLEQMDLPTLAQFVEGWAKANAKIFGDLGNSLSGPIKTAADQVISQVKETMAAQETNG